MKMLLTASLMLMSANLMAQSTMAVSPNEKQGALKVPVGINMVPGLVTGYKVEASCYGTNNRYTTNPLSPYSTVTMEITNVKANTKTTLTFPSLVTYGASTENWNSDLYKCSVKYSDGSTREAACMPNGLSAEVKDTDIMVSDLKPENFAIAYYQKGGGIPPAEKKVEFLGYEGKMDTVKTTLALKEVSGKPLIFIKAEFPGQDGFCGGFHSPLMLFFDEKQPGFTGKSGFLLKKSSKKLTYWPEKNHPGFFLVRFDDKDKKHSAPLLFGADKDNTDGFKALGQYDENKDGILDSKDSIFAKLYLWSDKNGDGKAQKNEVNTLEQKSVKVLKLTYDPSFSYDYGDRAKAKGMSTFTFEKEGKAQEGKIYDIYMNEI